MEAEDLTPPVYDSALPTWLMSHGAQHQDMMLACQNTADITGLVQQLARRIEPSEFDPNNFNHFITAYKGEDPRFWRVLFHVQPDPAKVQTLGFVK